MKYEIGQFVVATKDEDRFIKKGALCKVINHEYEYASCRVKDLSENPYKKGTWWLKPCNIRPATKNEIQQYENRMTVKVGMEVKIAEGISTWGDPLEAGWYTVDSLGQVGIHISDLFITCSKFKGNKGISRDQILKVREAKPRVTYPRVIDPSTLKGGDKVKIPKRVTDQCGDKVAKGWADVIESVPLIGQAEICDAEGREQMLSYKQLTGLRLKQAKPEPVERKYKVGDKAITSFNHKVTITEVSDNPLECMPYFYKTADGEISGRAAEDFLRPWVLTKEDLPLGTKVRILTKRSLGINIKENVHDIAEIASELHWGPEYSEESVTILVFNTDRYTFHKQFISIEYIELLDD